MIGSAVSPASAASARLQRERSYRTAMLAAVLAITLLRVWWLAVTPAGLYPDEAQYWFWAQHPAFGYYSKPPLAVWLIWLTTRLFGDSTFAIRLSAPLLHAVGAVFVYAIGARLYDRRTGFWSALAYASLPGISASSFIISTDAALLPCWAAALYAFIRAREGRSRLWWIAVGVAVGLGLLAKYAMAYWLISAFGFVLLVPAERRHLPSLLAAAFLAFLFYAPNLWWNAGNGFVSYLHLRDNAHLGGVLFHPGAMVKFVLSQFGIFGPIFFAGLLALLATGWGLAEARARLLLAFVVPPLLIILAISLLSRAEPNWAAPSYVAASVLVVAWLLARRWRGILVLAIALDIAAAVTIFAAPEVAAAFGAALPARFDVMHRLRGWRTLGQEVGAALAAHPGLRILADDRELVAELIYYVHPHPFDAAKWDPMRLVKDEWDLKNDLGRDTGKSFLVVSEHHYGPEMRKSFRVFQPLEVLHIPFAPGKSRRYSLYIARGFTGYLPVPH
jgi:4-amino-4-deoxy-L-arabinose transferase-like glycosyltransferase